MKRRKKKKVIKYNNENNAVVNIPIAEYLKRLEEKIDFNRDFMNLKFEKEELDKKKLEFHKVFLSTNREFNRREREIRDEKNRLKTLELKLTDFRKEKSDIEKQKKKLEEDFLNATDELHRLEAKIENEKEILKFEKNQIEKDRKHLLELKYELEEVEKRIKFERIRLKSKEAKINPYEVLGVSESSLNDDIKKAYRNLLSLYHPDKVHHLGEDLKKLAEKKTEQIMDSYKKIMDKKRLK